MILYILNSAFEPIGVIDEAESILWNKKYNDAGECEIYTPCDDDMLELLRIGNYVFRYDDDMFCRIDNVKITTDVENGDYITATAPDICTILSRRIVWDKISYRGLVRNFIKRLLEENVINPTITLRKIDNIVLDESNFSTLSGTMGTSTVSDDLLQIIIDTCKAYDFGFRMSLDITTKKIKFRLYRGADKSSPVGEKYVEFSPTFSNILSSEYSENDSSYKNYIVIGAKDSADKLMYVTVGDDSATGTGRREMFVDATGTTRDMSAAQLAQMFPDAVLSENTYYITEGGENIAVATVEEDRIEATDYTFAIMLQNLGHMQLANHSFNQSFSGNVDTIDTYEYKTDYDLGDRVRVINDYGISAEAQIVEVMESDDTDNGYQIEPKFEYKED